jgi:hypothetical protein
MYGGLVGTLEELNFIDNKLYPRRKNDPLKKLRLHFTDTEILDWLIKDIMKQKRKRTKKKVDVIPELEEEVVFSEPELAYANDSDGESTKSEVEVKKKKGRPKKYHTEEERKKMKLIQTLASNKKKRAEKKLNKK